MTLSLSHIKFILFILTFCAVVFGQWTYGRFSDRISLPFRFLEIFVALSYTLLLINLFIQKRKDVFGNTISFLLLLWVTLITLNTLIFNAFTTISDYQFIQISLYIYFHAVVVLYFFSNTVHNNDLVNYERYPRCVLFLLLTSSYVGAVLYLLHLIGLNNIRLGVNYHTDGMMPRIMGLSAEPSVFAIIAWIAFYLSYVATKKIDFRNIALLTIFIFSFSTTGIAFAILTIFISLLYTLNLKQLLLGMILIIVVVVLLPSDFQDRYIKRLSGEVIMLFRFFSENINISEYEAVTNSRAINFLTQVVKITTNFFSYLFGYGAGGQTLKSGILGESYRGLFYILVEFGLIGLTLVTIILIKMLRLANKNVKPLFLGYIIISFFNPTGGNFGSDFLFIITIIVILGNKNVSVSVHRPFEFRKIF